MANKLKNLVVTSVDLVDQGANPDANICLFKRKPDEPGEGDGTQEGEGKEGEGTSPQDGLQKGAKMFAETLNRETLRQITSEMYDFCYALSDSLSSIICDNDLTADSKQAMMGQSLKEFTQAMDASVAAWAKGDKTNVETETGNKEAGIQKSEAQQTALAVLLAKRGLSGAWRITEKEEYDTMKIDKSKMTQEELAVLESLEKKYGTADEPGGGEPVPGGGEPTPGEVGKSADGTVPAVPEGAEGSGSLHPDVQKALTEMRKSYEAQTAEVEALKKSLEIERLTSVAKKYEPLGKNSAELAAKLYDLKKSGGTVYDDYIALLDENLALIGKSGLFREIGSNMPGSAGAADTIGIKAAELTKSAGGGMTQADAIIKAFEENPELAAQYEQEYRRG